MENFSNEYRAELAAKEREERIAQATAAIPQLDKSTFDRMKNLMAGGVDIVDAYYEVQPEKTYKQQSKEQLDQLLANQKAMASQLQEMQKRL